MVEELPDSCEDSVIDGMFEVIESFEFDGDSGGFEYFYGFFCDGERDDIIIFSVAHEDLRLCTEFACDSFIFDESAGEADDAKGVAFQP